jgi:uncharacterized membrane protein YdjX (TVP38/TMEM64 family)
MSPGARGICRSSVRHNIAYISETEGFMKKPHAKKAGIMIATAGIMAVYFLFDIGSYFSLPYLKASQEHFRAMYGSHKAAVIAVYGIVYIFVTALSLPGAAVMTLAGGALFGLFSGTIIVSFASTIGATIACYVSRYLLRDWVRSKFGEKLSKIQAGIEREGTFYLFSLRLVPVFPFFIINLVMGLTPMRLATFYWVSQLGMIPGTIVYVNAGRELSKVESLSGILSLKLIFSFVLLGLFPIAAKKVLGWYKTKRGSDSKDAIL